MGFEQCSGCSRERHRGFGEAPASGRLFPRQGSEGRWSALFRRFSWTCSWAGSLAVLQDCGCLWEVPARVQGLLSFHPGLQQRAEQLS